MSSALGVFTPEESILNVYVRTWTLGREGEEGELKSGGVGATVTLITCSSPDKHIESMTCPLNMSINIVLSCVYCGWESKSSDEKCINGLCPGADFGVFKQTIIRPPAWSRGAVIPSTPSY